MSRVDEAMRRAAEQQPAVSSPADAPSVDSAAEFADASELAREAFPIELAEHRKTRPVAGFPAMVPPTPAAPPPTAARRDSLFHRMDPRLAQKVVIDQRVSAASREQYRRLAAALHHAQAASGIKVVMIASAVPGEGKTLTSSNLALTFSESYKRDVLLIDADLRKPALHTVFSVPNESGLGDGLASHDETKLAVRQVSSRLALLTAGVPSPDPMAGLTSERMRRVIEEARETFDWVIIDTSPVAFLPDANLLAAMVDVAVVVVKAGSTSYELVQRAVDAIGRERIIGVVLNRAESLTHPSEYKYYEAYYGARADLEHGPSA